MSSSALTIELDEDVALRLQERADVLCIPVVVLANVLLRTLLSTPDLSVRSKPQQSSASVSLPHDWFTYEIADGADALKPGLYEWSIEGRGSYIGRYTRPTRPRGDYEKNVRNLLNGRAYRAGKPNAFRTIHRELASAYLCGRPIVLKIVENCAGADAISRKRELILDRGSLNGLAQEHSFLTEEEA